MINTTKKIAKKINYKLFQAPRGYGEPVAQEVLNKQYEEGFWSFLDSIDELANYMVVVGYVQHFAKSLNRAPRLLDFGCGHGNLAELLSAYSFDNYLGVDVSEEAVRQARSRGLPNTDFEAADFEQWQTEQKFDFIVSTGSVNYLKHPVPFLKRYAESLTENGLFIVSLWRFGHNGVMWQNIEEHFEVVDSTVVTNHKNQMWDIKVFR